MLIIFLHFCDVLPLPCPALYLFRDGDIFTFITSPDLVKFVNTYLKMTEIIQLLLIYTQKFVKLNEYSSRLNCKDFLLHSTGMCDRTILGD